MAYIFGICNSAPAVVLKTLVAKKIIATEKDVTVIPLGSHLANREKPTKKMLIALNIMDLVRNLSVLNTPKYKSHIVFVFASPVRLSELDNVVNLDMTKDPSAKGFGYQLSHKIDIAKFRATIKQPVEKMQPVIRNEAEHLTVLTDSIKKGSLLTPLMTFIYSLPSSTLQTPVKIAVAKIIGKGLPLSSLDKLVSQVSDYKLSVTAKDKLMTILGSEVGQRYIDAFKHYRKLKREKSTASIPSIAKSFDVSPYEIRYLLSVIENDLKKDQAPAKKAPKAEQKAAPKRKTKAPTKRSKRETAEPTTRKRGRK